MGKVTLLPLSSLALILLPFPLLTSLPPLLPSSSHIHLPPVFCFPSYTSFFSVVSIPLDIPSLECTHPTPTTRIHYVTSSSPTLLQAPSPPETESVPNVTLPSFATPTLPKSTMGPSMSPFPTLPRMPTPPVPKNACYTTNQLLVRVLDPQKNQIWASFERLDSYVHSLYPKLAQLGLENFKLCAFGAEISPPTSSKTFWDFTRYHMVLSVRVRERGERERRGSTKERGEKLATCFSNIIYKTFVEEFVFEIVPNGGPLIQLEVRHNSMSFRYPSVFASINLSDLHTFMAAWFHLCPFSISLETSFGILPLSGGTLGDWLSAHPKVHLPKFRT